MMKVLAFCDVDWEEGSGGVEHTLSELYPRLVAGHPLDICLITLAQGCAPRCEERSGVRVVRARSLPLESLTGAQTSVSITVWRASVKAMRAFRPDVIHAHTLFYHTSLVAAAMAKRFDVPLLLTLHLGSLDALPAPYRIASQVYERTVGRAVLAAATRVICVSDDVRAHARSLGGAPRKLTVIPNGVDLVRFAPCMRVNPDVPTVLCVGRLIFNKGQHYLLDAVAALTEQGLGMRLVFVGDGPMEGRLRRRAAALGIGAITEFHGRSDRVDALLAQADIFVRPSLSEGMSLAILEAMAAGLPVIASDVSGVRQLIRNNTDGLVVPPRRVPELSAALARLLGDARLRNALGAHARQRALAYGWSRVVSATAEVMMHVGT